MGTFDRDAFIVILALLVCGAAFAVILWKPWEDDETCGTATYLNAEVRVCVEE